MFLKLDLDLCVHLATWRCVLTTQIPAPNSTYVYCNSRAESSRAQPERAYIKKQSVQSGRIRLPAAYMYTMASYQGKMLFRIESCFCKELMERFIEMIWVVQMLNIYSLDQNSTQMCYVNAKKYVFSILFIKYMSDNQRIYDLNMHICANILIYSQFCIS